VSFLIGITGKGGVGKTTIAALIVRRLVAAGRLPVLAVDADPNSCLDLALGMPVTSSVGSIREEARILAGKGLVAGISKQELLQLKISESLVEGKDVDLISMGRPEGPGCYCYANNVLKESIRRLSESYPYVVIDNEAGLENVSRRIVQKLDLLIMVADPSKRGIDTLERLFALAKEMGISFSKLAIIINRLRLGEVPPAAESIARSTGADIIAGLSDDSEIAECLENGRSLFTVSETNPVLSSIGTVLDSLIK
jgi:CO dehydrogenase maturation factor